ncbi:inositol-phosphate phosphatase, putative [Plasmodium knowlesi strain H]|uniref:phosphoinositide 5-phosphatase n=3 Tax=Plasmodium knowlesi TaxID=5850 RepID=A0A5K1UP24_PLAKH|nr:inositol-phosphate phosphatase, putative [Plasmodium knowlesi strain H]OTN68778.1 putative Inositol phosphatase [Plasmodium knowlesi]CAA9986124.1 inositol-phosphate phosphatase, putative [Plasmodium knowlesi strain H]SBO25296.1 inositol-phosphate phosphatase, putative [Plasmodium knowlesi strain H]SBO27620.1 inositol-phosphate phosphatase, putative [Plasmodium knowlesi strain H]VVS75598.1 inositol-phosphate phosphatase, putative [Plasmodium knowlesi strain H]|eukprot:XP_002257535.1 inositol phosphatase, putative [Plasmodium knowlesi strain H]
MNAYSTEGRYLLIIYEKVFKIIYIKNLKDNKNDKVKVPSLFIFRDSGKCTEKLINKDKIRKKSKKFGNVISELIIDNIIGTIEIKDELFLFVVDKWKLLCKFFYLNKYRSIYKIEKVHYIPYNINIVSFNTIISNALNVDDNSNSYFIDHLVNQEDIGKDFEVINNSSQSHSTAIAKFVRNPGDHHDDHRGHRVGSAQQKANSNDPSFEPGSSDNEIEKNYQMDQEDVYRKHFANKSSKINEDRGTSTWNKFGGEFEMEVEPTNYRTHTSGNYNKKEEKNKKILNFNTAKRWLTNQFNHKSFLNIISDITNYDGRGGAITGGGGGVVPGNVIEGVTSCLPGSSIGAGSSSHTRGGMERNEEEMMNTNSSTLDENEFMMQVLNGKEKFTRQENGGRPKRVTNSEHNCRGREEMEKENGISTYGANNHKNKSITTEPDAPYANKDDGDRKEHIGSPKININLIDDLFTDRKKDIAELTVAENQIVGQENQLNHLLHDDIKESYEKEGKNDQNNSLNCGKNEKKSSLWPPGENLPDDKGDIAGTEAADGGVPSNGNNDSYYQNLMCIYNDEKKGRIGSKNEGASSNVEEDKGIPINRGEESVGNSPKNGTTESKGDLKDLINNSYFNVRNNLGVVESSEHSEKRNSYPLSLKNANDQSMKTDEKKMNIKMDMHKMLKMIQKILTVHMYYSYDYDLTQCIQKKTKKNIQEVDVEPMFSSSSTHRKRSFLNVSEKNFMWNYQMIKKIKCKCKIDDNWFCSVIQGYISYTSIEINRRCLELLLISRRSSVLGGTRFNKRGINDDGYVANYVETEQIVRINNRNVTYLNRFDKANLALDNVKKQKASERGRSSVGINLGTLNKSQMNNLGLVQNSTADVAPENVVSHVANAPINLSKNMHEGELDPLGKMSYPQGEGKAPAGEGIVEANVNNERVTTGESSGGSHGCINSDSNFENRIISLVQIRGSIPLFWKQHSMSSHVNIQRSSLLSIKAFKEHNKKLITNYGNNIYYINLLSQSKNNEKKLTKKMIELINYIKKDKHYKEKNFINYIEYDFHISVKNKSFEDAMNDFINKVLLKEIKNVSFFMETSKTVIQDGANTNNSSSNNVTQNHPCVFQNGVFRTNCLDCLDRTNVFQYYYTLFFILYVLHVSKNDIFLKPVKKSHLCFYKNFNTLFNSKSVTIVTTLPTDSYLVELSEKSGISKNYEYSKGSSNSSCSLFEDYCYINEGETHQNEEGANVVSSVNNTSSANKTISANNTSSANNASSANNTSSVNNESSINNASSVKNGGSNVNNGSSLNSGGGKRECLKSEIMSRMEKEEKKHRMSYSNYDREDERKFSSRQEQPEEYVHILKHFFKKMWVENGDIISTHYTGTGSVFSSQINVGRSSLSTNIDHAIKSIERFYQNNFEDNFRQECIDIILCTGKYSKSKRRNFIGADFNYFLNYGNFMNKESFLGLRGRNMGLSIPYLPYGRNAQITNAHPAEGHIKGERDTSMENHPMGRSKHKASEFNSNSSDSSENGVENSSSLPEEEQEEDEGRLTWGRNKENRIGVPSKNEEVKKMEGRNAKERHSLVDYPLGEDVNFEDDKGRDDEEDSEEQQEEACQSPHIKDTRKIVKSSKRAKMKKTNKVHLAESESKEVVQTKREKAYGKSTSMSDMHPRRNVNNDSSADNTLNSNSSSSGSRSRSGSSYSENNVQKRRKKKKKRKNVNKKGKDKKNKSDLVYMKNLYKKKNYVYNVRNRNKYSDYLNHDLINHYYMDFDESKMGSSNRKKKITNNDYEEKIVKLWAGTWNLCGNDLYELNDISSWLNEINECIDMYVFCFQEVVELTGFRILMNMKDKFKEKKIEQKITQSLAEMSQRQKEMYIRSKIGTINGDNEESRGFTKHSVGTPHHTYDNRGSVNKEEINKGDYYEYCLKSFNESYMCEGASCMGSASNTANPVNTANARSSTQKGERGSFDQNGILDISKNCFLNNYFNNLEEDREETHPRLFVPSVSPSTPDEQNKLPNRNMPDEKMMVQEDPLSSRAPSNAQERNQSNNFLNVSGGRDNNGGNLLGENIIKSNDTNISSNINELFDGNLISSSNREVNNMCSNRDIFNLVDHTYGVNNHVGGNHYSGKGGRRDLEDMSVHNNGHSEEDKQCQVGRSKQSYMNQKEEKLMDDDMCGESENRKRADTNSIHFSSMQDVFQESKNRSSVNLIQLAEDDMDDCLRGKVGARTHSHVEGRNTQRSSASDEYPGSDYKNMGEKVPFKGKDVFLKNESNKYFLNLKKFKYVKLKSVSMIGLFIIIFIDEGLVDYIREIDVCKVKVGMKGNTGNKGSVSIKFRLGFNSFCFNNIHLASGQTNMFERNNQMQTILSNSFQNQELNNLFNFDYFFACGDFNFRINKNHEEVFKSIANKNANQLLNYDQFIYNKLYNILPFCLFYEHPILFNPTYKYKKNSNMYDVRRTPAWCDRILVSGKLIHLSELEKKRKEYMTQAFQPEKDEEGSGPQGGKKDDLNKSKSGQLKQTEGGEQLASKNPEGDDANDFYYNDRIYFNYLNYKTHNNFFSSDHKPVSAIIELKVFFDKKDIEYKLFNSYSMKTNDDYNSFVKNSSNTSNSSNNKNGNLLDYFFPNNYGLSKYTGYPISQILNYSNNLNSKFKNEMHDHSFHEDAMKNVDRLDDFSCAK